MLPSTMRTEARTAVVRAHVRATALPGRLRDGLAVRGVDPDQEGGAQAAEYAMLGGVSAAACSALIVLLKRKETLQRVVEAVLAALGRVIAGWF